MSRALFAATAIAALAAQPAFAGAKTSVQWGVDRTVSPNALCVYDGSNVCQPSLPNLGAAANGANTDVTSLGGGDPWFFFYGPDGSPQAMIGYAWGATQFPLLQGSLGGGGSVMCRSNTITYTTDNVSCGFGAANNGTPYIYNGWGTIANFISPGGNQNNIPLTLKAGNGSNTGDISYNGGAPTLGGSPPLSYGGATLNPLYAINANPDFWINTVSPGVTSSVTSGAIIDGWRTTDTQSGKLTFQWFSLSGLGQVIAGSTYGEKINVVSSYSVGSTDQFIVYQNLSGGEASSLQWGTTAPRTLLDDICFIVHGVSLPFNVAVSYENNGSAGTPDKSYVVLDSVTGLDGWRCFTNIIPGPTTGTWRSSTTDNYVGLTRAIDLGSGSTFQAGSTGSFVTGNFTTASGAGSLVGAPNGSYLIIGRSRLRSGTTAGYPYAPLPYEQELAKAQEHFYSTFASQTAPAQNVGINTGEIQFPAAVAGANSNVVSVPLPGTMKEHFGTGVSTFYNPGAANANCRDETANADGGAVTVLSWTSNRITIKCNGNAGTSVGNILGVHMALDGL